MRDTLDLIRIAALFLFGISLSATLHGLFSVQPSGVWFIPIVLLIVILACFALPDDLRFYGWLAAISIILGMLLWGQPWAETVSAQTPEIAQSICQDKALQFGWRFEDLRQGSIGKFICKFNN